MPVETFTNALSRAREAIHEFSRTSDPAYASAIREAVAASKESRVFLDCMDNEILADAAEWEAMGLSLAAVEAELGGLTRPPRGGGRGAPQQSIDLEVDVG
jgi:hypothetical protein